MKSTEVILQAGPISEEFQCDLKDERRTKRVKSIASTLAEKPNEWLAARDDKGFNKVLTLDGDSLKRPPRGFDPEHPCIDDIKRKDFTAYKTLSVKEVGSAALLDTVEQAFSAAGRQGGNRRCGAAIGEAANWQTPGI